MTPAPIPSPAEAPTLLDLLAEYRELRKITKDIDDDHDPAVVRAKEIEEKHLTDAKPQSFAEAVGLLKFALARSSWEVWGDEVLRGEKDRPATSDPADMFMPEAWNALGFLEQALAADVTITAKFVEWQQAVMYAREPGIGEAETSSRLDREDELSAEIAATPAASPMGIAIKVQQLLHVLNGGTPGRPFRPHLAVHSIADSGLQGRLEVALLQDISTVWPGLGRLLDTKLKGGDA